MAIQHIYNRENAALKPLVWGLLTLAPIMTELYLYVPQYTNSLGI